MEIYENRVKSFVTAKWPYLKDPSYPSVQQFAVAGFYAQPVDDASGDTVACYVCEKHLDGWESPDDPWEAHIRHGKIRRKEPGMKDEYLPCPLIALETFPNRLATFIRWPHAARQGMQATPETLAEAGFYFAPTMESPDLTRCYHCPVALDFWDVGDVPLAEHMKRSPECRHLKGLPSRPFEYEKIMSGKFLEPRLRKAVTGVPSTVLATPSVATRERKTVFPSLESQDPPPDTASRRRQAVPRRSIAVQQVDQESETWQTHVPGTARKAPNTAASQRRRPKESIAGHVEPRASSICRPLETPSRNLRKRTATLFDSQLEGMSAMAARSRHRTSGPVFEPISFPPLPPPSTVRSRRTAKKQMKELAPPSTPSRGPAPLPPLTEFAFVGGSPSSTTSTAKRPRRQLGLSIAEPSLPIPSTARRMVTRNQAATGTARVSTPVDIFTTTKKTRTRPPEPHLGAASLSSYVPDTPSARRQPVNALPAQSLPSLDSLISSARESLAAAVGNTTSTSFTVPDVRKLHLSPKTPATIRKTRRVLRQAPLAKDPDLSGIQALISSGLPITFHGAEERKQIAQHTPSFYAQQLGEDCQRLLEKRLNILKAETAKRVWEFVLKDGPAFLATHRPDLDILSTQVSASQYLSKEMFSLEEKITAALCQFSAATSSSVSSLNDFKDMLGSLFDEQMDIDLLAYDLTQIDQSASCAEVLLPKIERLREQLLQDLINSLSVLPVNEGDDDFSMLATPKGRPLPQAIEDGNYNTIVRFSLSSMAGKENRAGLANDKIEIKIPSLKGGKIIDLDDLPSLPRPLSNTTALKMPPSLNASGSTNGAASVEDKVYLLKANLMEVFRNYGDFL